MGHIDREILRQFAAKYIWWKTPGEALQHPDRVIAQVMDIGDYDDVQKLVAQVGDEYLREVLARAEIGQFTARSWAYWHYRLGSEWAADGGDGLFSVSSRVRGHGLIPSWRYNMSLPRK